MKLTNTIRDAFVRAVMNDVPSIDYEEQIRGIVEKDAVAQLPPKVRAIYLDKALRGYVATAWWGRRYGNGCSANIPSGAPDFKLSDAAQKRVDALSAEAETQNTRARDLNTRLRAVAYSVGTRKSLATALPEFEKYLPADEEAALRTVPVIANVVTDFVKAGWPKKTPKAKAVTA